MEGKNKDAAMSVASMVLGIVALLLSCCGLPLGGVCAIVSIVLAIIAIKGNKDGRGMAIAGLVCSIISLVMVVIVSVAGSILLGLLP